MCRGLDSLVSTPCAKRLLERNEISLVSDRSGRAPQRIPACPVQVAGDSTVSLRQQLCKRTCIDELAQRLDVYGLFSFRRIQQFVVAAVLPLPGVSDDTCSNHIEINIRQAPEQVSAGLHCCRMIPVVPECAAPALPPIVLLRCTAGYQLHRAMDFASTTIPDKQVNMIARHDVVENTESIAGTGNIHPMPPTAPIPSEAKQELSLMTAMRYVPDLSRNIRAIGARHNI